MPSTPPLVPFFIVCELIGLFATLAVFFTGIIARVRRHETWHVFCLSWAFSSLFYSLLFFAGQQQGGPNALDPRLCLVGASLLYGCPPMTACATLGLTIQVYFQIHDMVHKTSRRVAQWRQICLLAAPWAVFITMFVVAMSLGSVFPKSVIMAGSGTYCQITAVKSLAGIIGCTFVLLSLLGILVFEVLIASALFKNWRAFRDMGAQSSQSLAMFFRITAFTFWGIVSIFTSVLFLAESAQVLSYVLVCFSPIVAAAIFGSQLDIVHAWAFWKWGKKAALPPPDKEYSLTLKTSASFDSEKSTSKMAV